jgi:sec-independent protein translocase protein TatA
MFNNIGIPGLIIILIIALVVFGPSKLPQIGKAFGQTLREFRSSSKEIMEDMKDSASLEETTKKSN